ncbi:MAG: NAD(P)-dependent oxidoreductase, partial [Ponticaulis sp.]|nr:NAD(P)-dependent oxidoreductase [Ponticaulis sp.]
RNRDGNPKHVILRTAWVFSPYGKNFVKTMLTLGKSRDELNVVADQVGNPTYAPDIADISLAIVKNILANPEDETLYGTFHLTNSDHISWCGFAQEIFNQSSEMMGISCSVNAIPSSEYPTPAKRPAFSKLDCSSLEKSHGIERRHWKLALTDCLEALKPEFTS